MNIKLFYNLNYLEITDESVHATDNQLFRVFELNHTDTVKAKSIQERFLDTTEIKPFKVICKEVEALYIEFKKLFIYIEAAGGFIEKNEEFLFIHRLGQWDLPKGKREKKETIEDCALRECEEECGVKNLKIVTPLKPSYHIYSHKGSYALKKSYWFYMTTNYDEKLTPQLEEDINEVKWFNKHDTLQIVMPDTYQTIKGVIKDALKL
jgi:8-oxo-dGTP pyrophosphatase MutT (NUDIX family)